MKTPRDTQGTPALSCRSRRSPPGGRGLGEGGGGEGGGEGAGVGNSVEGEHGGPRRRGSAGGDAQSVAARSPAAARSLQTGGRVRGRRQEGARKVRGRCEYGLH